MSHPMSLAPSSRPICRRHASEWWEEEHPLERMRRIAVHRRLAEAQDAAVAEHPERDRFQVHAAIDLDREVQMRPAAGAAVAGQADRPAAPDPLAPLHQRAARRSEEHTSELQSIMRISYAVFC